MATVKIPRTRRQVRAGKRNRPTGNEPHHWYFVIETTAKAAVPVGAALIKILRSR